MDERGLTHWLKVLGVFALSLGLIVVAVSFLRLLGSAGVVIVAAILVTYLIVPIIGQTPVFVDTRHALDITAHGDDQIGAFDSLRIEQLRTGIRNVDSIFR